MTSGIYVIKCAGSDKAYVGSSKNVYQRWEQHKRDLKAGRHHSVKLQNAWNKYGENSFEFLLVEEVLDGFLTVYEQLYINKFNSCENGYNVLPVAASFCGDRPDDARLFANGKVRTPDEIKKIVKRFGKSVGNPSPKTEHLTQFETPWIKIPGKPRKTKLVRIPEDLLDEVLAFAHKLDAERHGQQAQN